ncbi:MAG: Lrp/AsnC ligand binding domain-containing protein [Prevotellaceae bacterium]|jgi:Lrp/AsnC family transcriptional regulator for asnA, asnC and gidA|nr:Lrp/AsnC ligand binding domain-containing protein [Prevotellaceae bacterium]
MGKRYDIDQLDQTILNTLIKNARMPFLEIAREHNISGAAVHQRVRKMEEAGIITGARLLVKPTALGLGVCAFVGVHLDMPKHYASTVEAIKNIPEVVECHFITGDYTLLLKLFCRDNEHLMNVLLNTLQNLPNVIKTETLISLKQIFERQVWVQNNVRNTKSA